MRIDERCFECLLSRVEFECGLVTGDAARISEILGACRTMLESYRSRPEEAPAIATEVHRLAYALLGESDPFRRLKEWNNRLAIEVCRRTRDRLRSFREKVLASIVANNLDYGVNNHRIDEDFLQFFRRAMDQGLEIDDVERMLGHTAEVVYFTDNCGEIVFDTLVIQELRRMGAHITLAVKGAPILNDATLEDALLLGLDRKVDLLTTTGSGDIGINLARIPPELRSAIRNATLIIAKGMANYESLDDVAGLPPVAFLMAVKCDVIAESVGAPRGSYIALLRE